MGFITESTGLIVLSRALHRVKELLFADIFTGSAEASLCKLRLDKEGRRVIVLKRLELKASGVADIAVRPDGRIFATAGWDQKIRIFSNKTCAPLAVLQVCIQPLASTANSSQHVSRAVQ